jgi:DNA recombination protein RmuC
MEITAIILISVSIVLLIAILSAINKNSKVDISQKLSEPINQNFSRIDTLMTDEFSRSRTDADKYARENREEYVNTHNRQLQSFSELFSRLSITIEDKLGKILEASLENSRKDRESLTKAFDNFNKELNANVKELNETQKKNSDDLIRKQSEQNKDNENRLERMRGTVEEKLKTLQDENSKKLDEMRATVDEKLQTTLEKRLGESFKLVSERLEKVHQGLGEMQQLATGVGDLKKVLTNVKTRGVLGEYQLENILDQMLTPDQYCKNVRTKSGSNAMVEFAVKFPGRDNKSNVLWLPIDSKFPKEDFELLMNAYDHGNAEQIDECRKNFVRGIKKSAGDICGKYIDPPNTTDFAILFLPFESLYAEVLRTPGLFDSIQRECNIIVTGPSTLAAFLSSLQMGFRTLVIEKRSSEVWQLLKAVKKEFGFFGGILEKTQKKLQEASNVIEQAGVRSRSIERTLKNVEQLPKETSALLLGEINETNFHMEEEEEVKSKSLFD